jgi:hypothetical protein
MAPWSIHRVGTCVLELPLLLPRLTRLVNNIAAIALFLILQISVLNPQVSSTQLRLHDPISYCRTRVKTIVTKSLTEYFSFFYNSNIGIPQKLISIFIQ